jgi:hypothetical protein
MVSRQDGRAEKKGLNAGAGGRLNSGFVGFVWVRWKNVSAGNRGLLGFNGKFRGTYAEGHGGPEWEAWSWIDASITSGFILAWRK